MFKYTTVNNLFLSNNINSCNLYLLLFDLVKDCLKNYLPKNKWMMKLNLDISLDAWYFGRSCE